MASYIATSTNWPTPVASAWRKAAMIPKDIISPENMSPTPGPTFVGVSAFGPVMSISPPMACASPRAQWEKLGANSTQAHSTYAGCQYELGLTDKSANEEQTLLKYCMERDGYRLQSY